MTTPMSISGASSTPSADTVAPGPTRGGGAGARASAVRVPITLGGGAGVRAPAVRIPITLPGIRADQATFFYRERSGLYHNIKAKTATLTLFTVVRGEDDAPIGKGNGITSKKLFNLTNPAEIKSVLCINVFVVVEAT